MSHWLKSVRPKTDADDDWTSSPGADEVLAAVHRRIATTGDPDRSRVGGWLGWARPRSRGVGLDRGRGLRRGRDRSHDVVPGHRRGTIGRRVWLPAGALTGAAVIAAVVVAVASSGGPGEPARPGAIGAAPLPAIRPAALLLSNYSSCSELLAGLRSHTAASVGPYGLLGRSVTYALDKSAGVGPAVPRPSTSSAAGANTSTTNVQEPGVDEPDVVKTDGDRLITITDGVLRVVADASRKVTGALDLSIYQGWQNAQLLVEGDHALVILGGNYSNQGPAYRLPSGGTSAAQSTYLFVDLAGTPKVTGSLRASGAHLDARLVGSTIRLVVTSAPTLNFPNYAGNDASSKVANQRAVRQGPLAAWLPQYSITNGADTTKYAVPCEQVSHPAKYTGASMLTIYTLDIGHLGAPPRPVSVAADGDTVYSTGSSLYIASNPDYWYCCQGPAATPVAQSTQLHRFDITGSTAPRYLGSASIAGRLLSQYSLSDYAGSLRIATTIGGFGTTAVQSSTVYVLNADTLKVTGHVDGLGRGEQIYAVRFIGAVAYVVTFRQTDPLYVVDLRDPAAPKVVSALHLTGYSDYLHDAGNGRLIGVGQEASPTGRVAGLQVSLFDVHNPAAPTRTGHVVRLDAPGEANLDPHAFLYWAPSGLVVVPIQSWAPSQSGRVLVLKVAGARLTAVGALANPRATGSTDDGQGIVRSLIVDGALWTVSGSGVQVSDPSTLTRQAWIPFD